MAQAAASNTDELLSQLASSEIDRLLAEADGNPAPDDEKTQKSRPSLGPLSEARFPPPILKHCQRIRTGRIARGRRI